MIYRCANCQAICSDKDGRTHDAARSLCEVCHVATWIRWENNPTDSNQQIGSAAFYRYPGDGKPLILVLYAESMTYGFHFADRSGMLRLEDGSPHELTSLNGALAWLRFLGYRYAGPYQLH